MPYFIKFTDTTHCDQQAHIIPDATTKSAGVMSAADKKKLDSCNCTGGTSAYSVTPIKTAAYIAKPNEVVRVAAPEGPWGDVTLPPAVGNAGKTVIVKNVATFFGVNIVPSGGDTIDGGASTGVAALESLFFVSDGISNWMIVASKP